MWYVLFEYKNLRLGGQSLIFAWLNKLTGKIPSEFGLITGMKVASTIVQAGSRYDSRRLQETGLQRLWLDNNPITGTGAIFHQRMPWFR